MMLKRRILICLAVMLVSHEALIADVTPTADIDISATINVSGLAPAHLALVEPWLRTNKGYIIAEDKDCECDDAFAYFQGGSDGDKNYVIENFHPYYSVGDFNGDGQLDFAVVVKAVKRGIDSKLILIFNGPFEGRIEDIKPFVFVSFHSGEMLFYYRYRKQPRLLVGRFETEGCAFEPTKNGYRVDCKVEENN